MLFACTILSTIIIFPLYYFATNFQGIYSLIVTILVLATILFIIARQAQKHGARQTLALTTKLFITATGFSSFFALVIHGKRLFAVIAIAAFTFFYMLSSKLLKNKNAELSSEKSI